MNVITIVDLATTFAENKDVAAQIRQQTLRPGLREKDQIRIDFAGVEGATQSFIHALISDLIRKEGARVLDRIEFKNCNAAVRSIIEIVVEYSQLTDQDA